MDNKQFFLNRYEQLGGTIVDINLKKSLRVNTFKITHEKFVKRMNLIGVELTKIPFLKDGYWAQAKFSLGAITEYLQGYYYLQEAAAQLPAQILNPQAEDIVLDMCAAPGGKTTQISQIMQNKGIVVAVEQKPHRLESLKSNVERMHAENTIIYRTDALALQKSAIKFDKILLDAPCAGNYVTDSYWFKKRDMDGIKKSAEIQKQLLKAAMNLLKTNGVLVYSTCSLEPEENELNMQWLLENFKVKLDQIKIDNSDIGDEGLTNVFGKKLSPEIKKCKRFWPHKTNTEGFFIARIIKC